MRNLLFFECLYGCDGCVGGITIVRTPATIELAIEIFWRPGTESIAPAIKLRLFVQVPVHQNGLTARALRACRGHFEKQHRCAARQSNDFEGQTRNLLCFDPCCSTFDDLIQITCLRPVRIESGGLGRNFDVFTELSDKIIVPGARDRGQDLRRIEHRDGSVHCFSLTFRRQACSRGSV